MLFRYQIIVILLQVILLSFLPEQAASNTLSTSSEPYQKCNFLSKNDPKAALEFSNQWLRRQNTPSALHCKALSLFNLERYEAAANILDRLHSKLSKSNTSLRYNILRQASKAWHLSGHPSTALQRLDKAINQLQLGKNTTIVHKRMLIETLLERASLYQSQGRMLDALQDLDHAESFDQLSSRVLLQRARLLADMGEKQVAIEDIETLLRQNPDNRAAKDLMRHILSKR